MQRTMMVVSAIALGASAVLVAAPVHADSYWEVEAARANARAGGPVSERDAELLERYGCLSGTRSAFCESLRGEKRSSYRAAEKRRARR